MIFIDNKYTSTYYRIIKAAARRKCGNEWHHIIPESFYINRRRSGPRGWIEGNPDDPSNKIHLTLREHAICHKLLPKMTTGIGKIKMELALWRMANSKSTRRFFSSREYEKCRSKFILEITAITTGKKRLPRTVSQQKVTSTKLSLALRGKKKSTKARENMKLGWETRDRTVGIATREKLQKSSSKYWATPEARQNNSIKRKAFLDKNPNKLAEMVGNVNRLISCEFCHKEMNVGNYKRWHGINCKINNALSLEN